MNLRLLNKIFRCIILFIRISDFEIDIFGNNEYNLDHEKDLFYYFEIHFILQIVVFSDFKIDNLEIIEEDLQKYLFLIIYFKMLTPLTNLLITILCFRDCSLR